MKVEHVVVLVQARMGSSRFPGKSLRPLMGEPLIGHVLARALDVGASDVALVTSTAGRDDALAAFAKKGGLSVARGPELDVLERMRLAAAHFGARVVVRVTGDCPLLAPDVCRRVVARFVLSPLPVDYVSNDTTSTGFPDGTDVEVFSAEALEEAARRATRQTDREHVTPWIRRHLRTAKVESARDLSALKLSVDEPADLERVSRVMQQARGWDLADTVAAAEACGLL